MCGWWPSEALGWDRESPKPPWPRTPPLPQCFCWARLMFGSYVGRCRRAAPAANGIALGFWERSPSRFLEERPPGRDLKPTGCPWTFTCRHQPCSLPAAGGKPPTFPSPATFRANGAFPLDHFHFQKRFLLTNTQAAFPSERRFL